MTNFIAEILQYENCHCPVYAAISMHAIQPCTEKTGSACGSSPLSEGH